MILIPGGHFTMGAGAEDRDAKQNERPQRKVYAGPFYIYRYEVTNGMFRRFVAATGYKPLGRWQSFDRPGLESHPAIYVTYRDAIAYCRWAGVSLPTEAQWEKAARGTDGRRYPWGSQWNPSYCNNRDLRDPALLKKAAPVAGGRGTLPVGAVAADKSPYGVMDMGGNINEWCRDWYDPACYRKGGTADPAGPEKGTERVLRGGGWSLPPHRSRCSSRWSGDVESPLDDYGFRCAAGPGFPRDRQGQKPLRKK
jgi:formylglycine-generating enzyme required for sulfatase activity